MGTGRVTAAGLEDKPPELYNQRFMEAMLTMQELAYLLEAEPEDLTPDQKEVLEALQGELSALDQQLSDGSFTPGLVPTGPKAAGLAADLYACVWPLVYGLVRPRWCNNPGRRLLFDTGVRDTHSHDLGLYLDQIKQSSSENTLGQAAH